MLVNFDTSIYFDLVKDFYGNNTGFDYYFSDIQKAVSFCENSEDIEVYSFTHETNSQIDAHISLIVNKNQKENIASFGFFECIDNENVFFEIWKKLINKAKSLKITKLNGPINGNIWFQYRVISISEKTDFFPSEPITKQYYIKFFRKLMNISEIEYHSAYRKNFETIIKLTESSYKQAINQNFSIERLEKFEQPSAKQLNEIYEISKTVFSINWGFSEISFEDFIKLYSSEKIEKYIGSIYLISYQEKIIGFCSNLIFAETMIMKTIAILPEHQNLGLGNALVHKVHLDALNQGIEKIIYALVRKSNKIKFFPTDDIKVFREYVAFEIEL